MGIIHSSYVSFRYLFTVPNSTSFTYRNYFALKLSVQHSETISPLFFLIVSISIFIPFYKSANSVKILWGVFVIWISMLLFFPYTSSGIWTQDLKVMQLCLNFGSAWLKWTVITKETNNWIVSVILWVSCLYYFYLLLNN